MPETAVHPWQSQDGKRKKQVLATVKSCGQHGLTWAQTAAMLGVSERTVDYWKSDDPEGKLRTAYEAGMGETAKRLATRLEAKALDPEEDGNTQALIHATKHFMKIGDRVTQTVVTPEDLSKDDSKAARRSEALKLLGLEALDAGGGDHREDEQPQ